MNDATIMRSLPRSSVAGLTPVELEAGDRSRLQALFDRNPSYFVAVNGAPPDSGTAREELGFELPEGWTCTRKCVIGYADDRGTLAGVASVIVDLLAAGVWHVGLLLLDDARHGTGQAQALYRDLESWAISGGARWMRLGVVEGNARAEAFWTSLGYVEMKKRTGVIMGRRKNTVRVMVKPLSSDLDRYLALMPRDRPE